jgi:hypothetical protein
MANKKAKLNPAIFAKIDRLLEIKTDQNIQITEH